MKKTILCAVLMGLASMASAASLTWGYGGAYLYVAKSGDSAAVQASSFTGEIASDAAFVLVYLGKSSTMDISTVSDANVVSSIAYGSSNDGYDDYASVSQASYVVSADGGTAKDGSSLSFSVNDYFGIAFWNGSSYTAIFDVTDYDTGTVGSALMPTVSITDLSTTTSFSLSATANATTDSYGIGMAGVAVPEPSTAALALAGLALLIKRRRA